MKIVYIVETLLPNGGIQRILTEKANYMSEIYKYDITIISCTQLAEQDNAFPLSKNIRQINLEVPYYAQYKYKFIHRLYAKITASRMLQKRLKEEIHRINPDIVIGVGNFQADRISKIDCNAKKVIECHEARSFTQASRGHKSVLSQLLVKYYKNKYFQDIEKNADAIVTLTIDDKKEWSHAKKVVTIPNFSLMTVSNYCNYKTKRIISVGRLSWEKGYSRLIEIWRIISPTHPDWQLDIFGEGPLYSELKKTISDHQIKNIHLRGNSRNISQEYSDCSICVVTSLYEGFSLVLLEALKHGIPCIAFDCPYGPRSIIEDGRCGFLVENNNNSEFAKKLTLLMENESLREEFSIAAVKSAERFSPSIVMLKWKKLFEDLILMQ